MPELSNISELVERAAARHPDRSCLLTPGGDVTYAQMAGLVDVAAGALRAMGVGPGDRIVVQMPNTATSVAVWLGAARVGAALVPANPALTDSEMARLVAQSRPSLVVASGDDPLNVQCRVAAADEVVARGSRTGAGGTTHQDPDTPVALIPTSGTTSAPKLVVQTHRSFLMAAEAFPWWMGLGEDDRLLTALPLFHLNALVYSTLAAFHLGVPLVLLERFSATTFWDDVAGSGATEFNAIGAMMEILMRQPVGGSERAHRLRLCYTAPAQPEHRHREIEERFGIRLMIGYGMSETPFGTIWPIAGPRPYGTMGRLRQHPRLGTVNYARVVDRTGEEVGTGEAGELLLRSPALMDGYFDQPEETARALAGGWLHTGDLVRLDGEGNFTHVGRLKEMIRRRVENIAPAEIESVMSEHPAVAGAAAIGVPSELGEEDVVAFFTSDTPDPPSEDAMRSWCEARLSAHKVPSKFIPLRSFPMTPTGRVAKHELRTLVP